MRAFPKARGLPLVHDTARVAVEWLPPGLILERALGQRALPAVAREKFFAGELFS